LGNTSRFKTAGKSITNEGQQNKFNIGDLVMVDLKWSTVLPPKSRGPGMIIKQARYDPRSYKILYPDGVEHWIAQEGMKKIA